jgi:hypothetical protein
VRIFQESNVDTIIAVDDMLTRCNAKRGCRGQWSMFDIDPPHATEDDDQRRLS